MTPPAPFEVVTTLLVVLELAVEELLTEELLTEVEVAPPAPTPLVLPVVETLLVTDRLPVPPAATPVVLLLVSELVSAVAALIEFAVFA